MRKNTFFKFNFLIVYFLFFSAFAFCQNTSIIQIKSLQDVTLNSSQRINFNKFSLSQNYRNSNIVQVGNLANLATNASVMISLPFLPCQGITFIAKKVEYFSENDYLWYGVFDNADTLNTTCTYGTILLMAKDGKKFGTIIIDEKSYEYHDLSNGYQVLAQANTEMYGENECGVNASTLIGNDTIAQRVIPCAADNNQVRILVLWTQAAQNAEIDMNFRIALAIQQTNLAYFNSAMPNVTLVSAGSQLLPSFTESIDGNIQRDVQTFSNRPDVQALRSNFNADIVVLLTNGNYGPVNGIVRAIGPSLNEAYSIVQTLAATSGRYTFAHEVGHLFGARHDNDNAGSIEHGYIFDTRRWFLGKKIKHYTLLATMPTGLTRELNYSNPYVQLHGKNTGTNGFNNNAWRLLQTFPTVSSFSPNPLPPFSIGMDISASYPNCMPYYVDAVTQCGTAPFAYNWELSFDGINYGYQGNQQTLFIGGGCPGFPLFMFFRLTVTDATGLVKVATGLRPVGLYGYRTNTTTTAPIVTAQIEAKLIEEVYPNPSSSSTRVLLNLPEKGNVKLVLTDMFGVNKKVLKEGVLQKGRNLVFFNTSDLITGNYTIRVIYNNKIETKQLIVNK